MNLISNSGYKSPNYYEIYEHDLTNSDDRFLFVINKASGGIVIEGFIPVKNQTGENNDGDFIINVTSPENGVFTCQFRQPIEEMFMKIFPADFHPLTENISSGIYIINAYLSGNKIMDSRCSHEKYNIICNNGNEGGLIYSSIDQCGLTGESSR